MPQKILPMKSRDLELLLIRQELFSMLMRGMLANLRKFSRKLKKVEDKWTFNCIDARLSQSSSSQVAPEVAMTKVAEAEEAMVAAGAVVAMVAEVALATVVAEVGAHLVAAEAEAEVEEMVAVVDPTKKPQSS